jgi:hypothetical protein
MTRHMMSQRVFVGEMRLGLLLSSTDAIAYRQKRARILVHAQPNQSKNLYLVQMTYILTYQST